MSETALGRRSIVHYGRHGRPCDPLRLSHLRSWRRPLPTGGAPPDFDAYLEKVRHRAYSITDEDVQALKDAGYSEDEIFEYTVSAAVAAGSSGWTPGSSSSMRLDCVDSGHDPAEARVLELHPKQRGREPPMS